MRFWELLLEDAAPAPKNGNVATSSILVSGVSVPKPPVATLPPLNAGIP
jgi:hypothetical protein